ncbi:Gfo/Idh/MocA family oxidoreductase [Amycolatopsis sp. SID8362]|uniref:Gfo/Idh/MocA family protein n=1 Tax=Amycolatopsis sp. SID8362 TaxID=2690346 RepID=UPI00136B33FB|nr:Gfo/Idh/MocA family oxidoreductase [Amycolatopsis sp. SID8362]NBH02614.1 Gfo/Idh/MocA family oxidoreductase [Amycolatopsis sp. SID8362]NED39317.1 Gfo/Idh/MocA family oxidoreductase [Amycolatopsis sp. SID8362]
MTHGKRLRVAVVGAGGIAAGHRAAFQSYRDDVDIVAAADVDEARAVAFCAEAGNAKPYGDLDTLLAEQEPDLVSICTPPGLHVEQTTKALDSGAWVWCEKPPCRSLAEYDEMAAAEREGGPYVSFVFQQRSGAGAAHFRSLLAEGELGRPLVAHCQTTWYRDAAYYAVPWRGRWDSEGGGPAMGHGIHQMDLLLHLLGDWVEVRAMTARLVHDVETEDVSTALVRFESGALATVVNSVLSPDEVSRIRVDCENATVELTHLYGYGAKDWRYTPAPHVAEKATKRWSVASADVSSHVAAFGPVLVAHRAGRRPPCSGEDGRRVLEFVAALYKSADTGLAVRRGEIVPGDAFHRSMAGARA